MTEKEQKDLFTYTDLSGFIKSFLYIQNLYQSVSDFDLIFSDFADYLTANGITYCEAFFSPTAFLKTGMQYGQIMKNFSDNIAKIKRERNITVKILVDVSRTFGCANASANYELLKRYYSSAIIGIGLGGAEQKGPAAEFASVFTHARKDGFHVVAHAGEDSGPKSIWDAIRLLHAERIGHGITAVEDKSLMEYLKDTKLPIEICVTSNVFTQKYVKQIVEHPVRRMFDEGLFITINTDDPVFFNTTLIDEYWKIYDKLNFSLDEIKQIICNGYMASFASDTEKKKYLAAVNAAWEENAALRQ